MSALLRVLGEYWMCIWYGFVECFMGVLGEYWICVFGQIPLSVLWRVLCEYWMCIFGQVSLSV